APHTRGGAKQIAALRPGAELNESAVRRALRTIQNDPTPRATPASTVQVASHPPAAPQPQTAVKEPAFSIVSRMKRRLSIAWAWRSRGGAWTERTGCSGSTDLTYAAPRITVKGFARS